MRRSESPWGAVAVVGLVALALLLAGLVVVTARRFSAHSTTAPAASAPPTAEPVVVERTRQYVRIADRAGARWTYVAEPGGPLDSQGLMVVPRDAELIVAPRASRGSIGIGVRLRADRYELSAVQQDGRDVPVQVRLLDAQGRTVASTSGNLAKFGFG